MEMIVRQIITRHSNVDVRRDGATITNKLTTNDSTKR